MNSGMQLIERLKDIENELHRCLDMAFREDACAHPCQHVKKFV